MGLTRMNTDGGTDRRSLPPSMAVNATRAKARSPGQTDTEVFGVFSDYVSEVERRERGTVYRGDELRGLLGGLQGLKKVTHLYHRLDPNTNPNPEQKLSPNRSRSRNITVTVTLTLTVTLAVTLAVAVTYP